MGFRGLLQRAGRRFAGGGPGSARLGTARPVPARLVPACLVPACLVPACLVAACLVAASLLAGAPQAHAQGMVRNTYGDWQLRCETPAGAKAEQCALVQYLAAEDRPNLTLVVIVLKTADNRGYLLRVVAPLGVLLPSGLGLKIDKTDVGRAGFVRCLTTGCVAEVVMDDGLVKQFSGGAQATFIVFQTPEEGVGIPLSMKGFGQGFDSLR